jgi:hypothetical protein
MSENRRQAYRYATMPDARALLRTSDGEVVVQIVNESASGFGVEADRELALNIGELTGLTTKSGQSICRVIRVEHDELGKTIVGLQRISEVADEPEMSGNSHLMFRWFGRNAGSVALLLAFGLGLGIAMGLAKSQVWLSGGTKSSTARTVTLPRDTNQRASALARQFNNLDKLTSRQFIKVLKLTNGQQQRIDRVVESLVGEMSKVHIDKTNGSPEDVAHMGLLMIRRAWIQVEDVLTPDQMAKWDAILDGTLGPTESDQAGL